jgi:hypothetical protein
LVYFFIFTLWKEGGLEMNNDFLTVGLFILAFTLFWGFTLFTKKA